MKKPDDDEIQPYYIRKTVTRPNEDIAAARAILVRWARYFTTLYQRITKR